VPRIVRLPLRQAIGILTDLLGFARFELSLPMMRRMMRQLEVAGIDYEKLGPVDLSKILPILESGSVASEESMQERWASLLAHAVSGSPAAIAPSFPEILRQLEPIEARILDLVYENSPPAVVAPKGGGGWSAVDIESHGKLPQGTVTQSRLENIVRLGLAYQQIKGTMGGAHVVRDTITLSPLGKDFVKACRPPEPQSHPR
jgi:hypothetical protein